MNRLAKTILIALWIGSYSGIAQAQLYVAQPQSNTISKYDADTGVLINGSFITGLSNPHGLTVAGNVLYETEYGNGTVGEYDATTGAPINTALIRGLSSPQAVAISGDDLFVTSLDGEGTGMVGKYNAKTGEPINALFILRLQSPMGVAVFNGKIFVVCGNDMGSLGEYDANTGAVINPSLASLASPNGLVLSENYLWATNGVNAPSGSVSKFDANTGANVMSFRRPLIAGLNYPNTLAVTGDNLFVASVSDGMIGKYSAIDGTVINASFISGLKADLSGIATVATSPSSAIALKGKEFAWGQDVLQFFILLINSDNYIYFGGFFFIGLLLLWAFMMFMKERSMGATEVVPENSESSPAVEEPPQNPARRSLAKPMLIGSVIMVFLLIGGYAAYQVGMALYIAKLNSLKVVARQEVEAEQKKAQPPVRLATPPTVVTLPATLVDPENFQTENNWLASMIGKRIVSLVYLALNPTQTSLPDIQAHAKVDEAEHQVHLEISGFSADPVVVDLQPDFAWDSQGYSPLAIKLLGTPPPTFSQPRDALPDELTILLQPTPAHLAAEDVALSALLQKYPGWSAAHEQAALLLVALALRDRAGYYSDSRSMLCRATAHLALAQALRGSSQATWSGEIADAAIRTLSGREVDATAHLDALAARTDCPPAAQTWITALRLRVKDDWRLATPDGNSPLLLKIVWAQVLNDNLTALGAVAQMKKLGVLEDVSDWGHAVLSNGVEDAVETLNVYCEPTTEKELQELGLELTAEGSPPAADQKIGSVLSEPFQEKLFVGDPPAFKIIGPDMFKDFARQHLMVELSETIDWLSNMLGEADEAKKFQVAAWEQFGGMRRFEDLGFFAEKYFNAEDVNRELGKEHTTWEPWELADGQMPGNQNLANIHPDIDTLHNFYQDGLPFGTAYNIDYRMQTLWIGAARHKAQSPADINYNLPTYPYAKDLQKLAPNSFTVFMLDKNQRDFLKITQPWWDYNIDSIEEAEKLRDSLDKEDYIMLLKKEAALDPNIWFALGSLLRKDGKDDDAAVADRKGFEEAYDQVVVANSVGPLVDYYFDHDRKDEAEMVAKHAAEVYSKGGLMTYCKLLEKLGRLPEAEENAKAIAERYGDLSEVDRLHAAHKEFFQDENKILLDQIFPHGMEKVTISSFKDAPTVGVVFNSDGPLLQQGSLQVRDVVVGFDGFKIENEGQYDYVRALSHDAHMDLIIWRKDRYLEVHTSAPNRRFQVDLVNYPAPTHL